MILSNSCYNWIGCQNCQILYSDSSKRLLTTPNGLRNKNRKGGIAIIQDCTPMELETYHHALHQKNKSALSTIGLDSLKKLTTYI